MRMYSLQVCVSCVNRSAAFFFKLVNWSSESSSGFHPEVLVWGGGLKMIMYISDFSKVDQGSPSQYTSIYFES